MQITISDEATRTILESVLWHAMSEAVGSGEVAGEDSMFAAVGTVA